MKIKRAFITFISFSASSYALSTGEVGVGTADLDGYSSPSNASGSALIDGLNVTSSTTSLVIDLEWTLSANVTEITSSELQSISSGKAITYSTIGIEYPGAASLASNSTSAWSICALIIENLYRNATVAGQDDDGTCKATLGNDCIFALQDAVLDVTRSGNTCTSLSTIPAACNGSISTNSLSAITVDPTNSTTFYTISTEHDTKNTTSYETAVTDVHPIVLSFRTKNDTGSGTSGAITAQAAVGCVRASNASAGSETVTEVPGKNAAIRVTMSYITVLVGLSGVLALW